MHDIYLNVQMYFTMGFFNLLSSFNFLTFIVLLPNNYSVFAAWNIVEIVKS